MKRFYLIATVLILLLFQQGCCMTNMIASIAGDALHGNAAEQPPFDASETPHATSFLGITNDGMFEYVIDTGEAEIVDVLVDHSQITIPDEINGYPVTSIGKNAFYQNSECRSVILPQTLKKIESAAFYRCYKLERITIPASVTYIACDAFFRTDSLCGVFVDMDNEEYCDMDGILFSADKNVLICYPEGRKCEEYTLPDSVSKIESHALGYYPAVNRLIIQNSTVSFPQNAFTVFVDALTIVSNQGSSAEAYALQWQIPFEKA